MRFSAQKISKLEVFEYLPLLSTFTMVLRTESIDLNFTLSLGVAVEPDGPDDFFLFLSVLSAPLISVLPVQQLPITILNTNL